MKYKYQYEVERSETAGDKQEKETSTLGGLSIENLTAQNSCEDAENRERLENGYFLPFQDKNHKYGTPESWAEFVNVTAY